MMRRRGRSGWGIFPLAGWLFTDLLLAMMMIFLVAASNGIPNRAHANTSPTPTPAPLVCGIDQNYHDALITVSDPSGVRAQTAPAMDSFFSDASNNPTLRADATRVAGVVEVFGGSNNVADGVQFAAGAIRSLQLHSNGQFIFSRRTVYFKPLWDGTIDSNQVRIYVFYYILATSCGGK